MQFNKNEVDILSGYKSIKIFSSKVFTNLSIDFLNDLSQMILKNKNSKRFPELISYGFWCRKSNLIKMSESIHNKKFLVGRGLAFHLPPTNVPINFLYSFSFGLLNGNSNIIKLPSKKYDSIKYVLNILNQIFKKKKYNKIYKSNLFVRYDSGNQKITEMISSKSDVRLIWGGNEKVSEIKSIKAKINTVDVSFFDKFSISVLDAKKIKNLSKDAFEKLCYDFYTDAFFMDQNACGSPHIIFWLNNIETVKKKFWNKVSNFVEKIYLSEDISSIDRFYQANKDVLNFKDNLKIYKYKNLYVSKLTKLPSELTTLRGKWGYFYEYNLNQLNNLKNYINISFQTMIYFGLSKKNIENFLNQNLKGIDRIVPVGQAHNINNIWDGYNLTYFLSREIDIK